MGMNFCYCVLGLMFGDGVVVGVLGFVCIRMCCFWLSFGELCVVGIVGEVFIFFSLLIVLGIWLNGYLDLEVFLKCFIFKLGLGRVEVVVGEVFFFFL